MALFDEAISPLIILPATMSPHSSTSSGSAASTARLSTHRRLSRSSSSSDESYRSITSDVDPRDSFYNSELLARGPYLCSLPARTMSIDIHWYEHYIQFMSESAALCRMISDLLETQGMLRATVEITGRQFKVDPEHHALPTILVLASKREQPVGRDWCAISRAMYRWMSGRFPGINVEILDEDEAQTSKCYPVMETDSIYPNRVITQGLSCRNWISDNGRPSSAAAMEFRDSPPKPRHRSSDSVLPCGGLVPVFPDQNTSYPSFIRGDDPRCCFSAR